MHYQPHHYAALGEPHRHPNFFPARSREDVRVRQIAPGVYRADGRSNAGWVVTEAGIVLIDAAYNADALIRALRATSDKPVRYVIYTHGHADHTFTERHLATFAHPETRVLAHAFVPQRLEKNVFLAPHAEKLRQVQFGRNAGPVRDTRRKVPDLTYHGEHTFTLGGVTFNLFHGRGETDDATIVHVVERGVVFTGDFLVGSWPNLGNPYKVPRYGREWYQTLERVGALAPKALVPGHGYDLLETPETVAACLGDTVRGLRHVHDEVVQRLNAGQPLSRMVAEIHLPPALEASPYLAQVYSRVELAVIAFHRGYTGWFEGEPGEIYPAGRAVVAGALRSLIGNDEAILERAAELWRQGGRDEAVEILQVLLRDEPGHPAARQLRGSFMQTLADEDCCLMTRSAWEHFAALDAAASD